MSFTPIDPNSFQVPGRNSSSFRTSDIHTSVPLTQPESDPSIVMDIDNSTAIDTVRGLLSSDFTTSWASWLHLFASLLTDACNGVRTSILTSSLDRFRNLSTSEKTTLTSLKLALEAFESFFDDVQDDEDDWITCMGCVNTFQLPSLKDEWSVNLSECSGNVEEARRVIVDQAVAATHLHVQSWVDGERVSAQDTAINSLTSNHAPDISTLISDPCLVEWLRRLLEVMKHHFTETLISDASHTLPSSLIDRLDAERQAKFNTAEEDACADAKHLYKAELLRRQSAALSEASADFSAWMDSTLTPEFQAKKLASRAHAERELARFQTDLETEFAAKRQTVLAAANDDLATFQLVHAQVPEPHSSGDDLTLDKRARRAKRRADPISRPSRSVSCARSLSPSPSQKLDKTPTKADFQVGQVTVAPATPVAVVMPLVGPNNAKASVGTLGDADSGRTLTPGCPGTPPAAALLDTHVVFSPNVVMALAAPSGAACPSPAKPKRVNGTGVTPRAAQLSTLTDPAHRVSLVHHYQSVTPSPASPPAAVETAEDCMMCLLGSTITAALVPLKLSIEDISSHLRSIEDAQNWDGDDPMNFPPAGASDYCTPTMKLEDGDEERVDYHVASTLSHAEAEDEEMDEAREKLATQSQDEHPYFATIVMRACKDRPEDYADGQLQALASKVRDDWDDFCGHYSIPSYILPPSDIVDETFLKIVRIRLTQAQVFNDFRRANKAACGSTVSSAPEVSHFTGTWRGEAHLLRKDGTDLPHTPTPPPGERASLSTSVSSDGSKISGFTESSPPAMHHQGTSGVLDLSTPPLGDGHGWSVMGGKKGRSFASIAATTRPSAPPAGTPLLLSAAAAAHGFLTKPQLDSLTRAQVINAYNARFSPKLSLKVSKDTAVAAFLDKASCPAPPPQASPKPVTKTEFTLVYDTCAGDLAAPSGCHGDAASYIRTIQKHVQEAGMKQAELIGGHWTSQTLRNFVLTFNGSPSLDDVLRLQSTFARVLGPHYSIVPSQGYTCIVLNSVPTMRETLEAPLPLAMALHAELSCNKGLKDLILLGDPYWLTARHPNACHGSISIAFLDQDGSHLKDILRNLPFMFGNQTSKPRKYKACPLILQCDRCWMLGHTSLCCSCPKDTLVCPWCAGAHTKDEHHRKCQAVSKHMEVYCTCPVVCINCRHARKPAQGHSALSLLCPLRSKFRSPLVCAGDSSDEKKGVNATAPQAPSSPSPDVMMLTDGETPAPPLIVTPASSL